MFILNTASLKCVVSIVNTASRTYVVGIENSAPKGIVRIL